MKKYFCIAAASLLIASCSPYQKALKNEDLAKKYEVGTQMYDAKKYNKAIRLYEQVTGPYRGKPSAEGLFYRLAMSYYNTKQYYLSSHQFDTFVSAYPTSEKREEAMFLSAKSYSQLSATYTLDQEDTDTAIDKIQTFINTYPESEYLPEANKLMAEMNDKLERKAFEIAKQYNTIIDYTQSYKAATVALDNFILDYPGTKYKVDALYLKLDTAYRLALKSVKAKKEERLLDAEKAYNALNRYNSDSKYKGKADKMLATIKEELELLK
ncbi:MAG: outer membrane protein assembly factor BamD [Flavobacterium sp.]|nr:outer membrane protein assembly factor BamD [Candidatus Neoflavobacterium equi]